MFEDGVDGVNGVNGEQEREKSSSFYVPEKPANPGQSDPNMVCKNWLESPFDDVIFEETYVQKSFSCWNGNFGSTSQTSVTDDTLSMFSCRDLLALAEASGGFSGETQHSGRVNLCDLNWPPQFVAEPPGLSLQFTPLTPDQMRRGSDIVVPNEDKRMNLAADKDVGGNQDSEKGLTEEMNLNTPQKEQKRRKHRPKVVTEGKPRRARKPATPKPPDGSGSSTGKRKYVRRKGVEKSTETPETPGGDESREIGGVIHPTPKQPDGSSTGKRKYVWKNRVEKSTETPVVDASNETGGIIHPTPARQTKKTCKRKIDFDESEKQSEITVDKACTMTSEVVERYQKVHETESLSPITPSKTELPQARTERSSTKAKCKINFLQETHDKGQIHVANLNETGSSMSVCNKGDEAHSSNWELYSEIDGIKHMHERRLEICHENLETYLSIFTDYHSGWKQCTQSYAVNERKGKAPEMSNDRYMQTYGQNTKRKKTMVRNYVPFNGRVEGGYQPQHTYMESHAADFQLSIPNKKRTKKSSAVPSLYHDSRGYNSNFGYETLYSAIDELIVRLELLHIGRDAVVQGYHEKNALVVYQQDRSLVPYVKKRKQRPKVDLDEETNRVWMLLLEDINSQGIDGTDEDKAKWWEEERRVFRGRADSFIARMHLVQGDRRFSQWKGSVLDSVVGVFLTQNVSDHLSSSAFMSLAAQYPLKPNTNSEPTEMNTSSEPLHEEESGDHDVIPMMLQEADSCEEKEIINSNEFSKNCVISDNSECEVAELSEKDSTMCKESVINHIEVDEVVSSQNSADICSTCKSEEQKDKGKATVSECTSFVELLQMQGPTRVYEGKIIQYNSERSVSEESGISAESASQTTGQMVNTVSSQESANSNCMMQRGLETTNLSTETSNASEINNNVETSQDLVQKEVDFHLNENGGNQIINGMDEGCSKVEIKKTEKKETKVDWDNLRLQAESEQKRERTPGTMDSMDYEAIRAADVKDVADAIKERGMNNRLAERIKDMLDRVVEDHGSIDLEWLRDVPPDKAKEYLLSFRGLGLKSVECIRLLTLQHLAFPVDTNVGRIAVRLGWVPLQALPESLQLHLLELYPVQESIQKYLWPRLCKLDQRTLYELHYQMITFGKVFCTKTKPNCNACPLRGECRHFASAFASARLALPAPEQSIAGSTEHRTGQNPIGMIDLPSTSEQSKQLSVVQNSNLVIEEPATKQLSVVQNSNPVIEEPTTPEPIIEVPATPEEEQIQQEILDIEDFGKDTEEIPMIKLNIEEFTQNLQTYMERHMELGEGDMSKALVALTSEAASIPTPKLKNVSQLRTEHQVYELPDSHPLLEGLDTREIDDPCSYLLAIWTPGESADSIQPPEGQCCTHESGTLCNEETCFFCNSTREANSQTVRGTLLIPCRTAMRGSFPLNGTYFQVNEVFADHASSLNPIDVPRAWLWNLPRRTVYFGTSIPTIFKGLTTEEIQYCFWRGFVCVRGFDREKRAPRPLRARLHYPASRLKKTTKPKTDEKDKLMQQQYQQ